MAGGRAAAATDVVAGRRIKAAASPVIDRRHEIGDRAIDHLGDTMKFRHALLAAAIATAWLPGQSARAWISKQVRDWTVECSNGLTCKMSYSDWSAKGMQYVGFERKGEPNAGVDLRLRAHTDFSPDTDQGVTFRFTVDGKELLALTTKDLVQGEHADVYSYSDQPRVLALLAAMETGKTAEVTVTGAGGTQVLPVKLNGVTGAMLYADEVQGRLGRVDALQAKGDTQAGRNETAKEILSLEDMPEIIRKEFTESGGACSDLEPETIGQFQGFHVTVGKTELIGVPCSTGGAYNQPYALYTVGEIVERIAFPYVEEGRPMATSTAMNIELDPVAKTLTSFFRGRGIGDCGEYFKWKIDDVRGSLELVEMRNKGQCDEGSNDPTTFPLVWPVKP